MRRFINKLLIGFVEEEIEKRAFAATNTLLEVEGRQVKNLLAQRRAELASSTPIGAVTRLIDKLEREEGKRNAYAGVMWRIAQSSLGPQAIEDLKAEVSAIERM